MVGAPEVREGSISAKGHQGPLVICALSLDEGEAVGIAGKAAMLRAK